MPVPKHYNRVARRRREDDLDGSVATDADERSYRGAGKAQGEIDGAGPDSIPFGAAPTPADPLDSSAGDASLPDGPLTGAEFDSIEEVDAVVRGLRRVALEYGAAILAVLFSVPLLSLVADWWFANRIWGGFTLNFITVALGLHVTFVVLAVLYTRVADRSEKDMLGRLEGERAGDV